VYEVNGQVHPSHTDLYFGTQDNDVWASPDNGASWPAAGCCEGFFFQTPYTTSSDSGQTIAFVTCAGCGNRQSPAHFGGCGYNPACSAWTSPSGASPGPDSGAPRDIQDKVYVQWSQATAPNKQLNLTTNSGGAWSTVTNATISQTLMSHPFVAGPTSAPTIYQPICTSGCGFIAPSGSLMQITGARTSSATVTQAGSSLGRLGAYNDGVGSWLTQEAAFGVDPGNPQHLIAADVQNSQMKQSTDGGATWTVDQRLTNFVTGFGRYRFTIPVFGTQAHAIAFDPNNGNRILVGTHEAGIIASTDGGQTWTTVLGSRQIPNVTSFFFDNVQNDILVSSFGRGIWKLDLTPRAATLAYNGATSGDFHDQVTLSANLFDQAGGPSVPIIGATVTLTLGSQACPNLTTDSNGHVSCQITLTQVPGPYTVVASFAGNAQWSGVTTSVPFTITREETTTTYDGPTVIANGQSASLSATLKEDGTVPISGRPISMQLGTGASAQSCTGITDASGQAQCTITLVNQPLGPGTVTATFAGDAFYLPSSDTKPTILFAFPERGAFAIGDQSVNLGHTVEFWGARWSTLNSLSGGVAPASFKGFASNTTEPPVCAAPWTARPGNAGRPPDQVPSVMGVLVASSISKQGPSILGNTVEIVVINTDPGYTGNPGHPGTGRVVASTTDPSQPAVLCHA
jgi:hypothetical protein